MFEPRVGRFMSWKKLFSCSMSVKMVSLDVSANPEPFTHWMLGKLKSPSKIISLILELIAYFTKPFKLWRKSFSASGGL